MSFPVPNSEMAGFMGGKTQTEQVMTAEQFVDALAVNGLLSDSDLGLVRESWLSETKSAEELARRLVGEGRLTAFQARRVYAGKAHVLVLGNYVVQEKLGSGGMGDVYKATHRVMKRDVAVKVLPSKLVNNAQAVQRFHREVQAAARLSHVNIVTAHDAAEFRGVHYLVMECVEGRDLAALVRANGPLPVDQAVNCVLQTAQGLDYAHQNGIVHRDIKPHNLLLDVSGTIKILDMGLAQFTETDAGEDGLTSTGTVMGTADYMSPEQAVDTKNVDARSDIYSLGATLFYLLAGRAMYSGETMISRILAHRDQPVPDLIEANAAVSPALNAIYQKMVAKSVGERYQSMSEVIAELERCQMTDSSQTTLQINRDPELLRFLRDREVDAGAQNLEGLASAPTMSETAVSGRPFEETFTRSVRKPQPHRTGPQGTILAVAAVGVLGLVALLAGIFLRVDAPAGTIVLEIDQPEAIGAVVTVDGVKKITVKSDGEEPIEITADEKQHTLKVTKGGFETFTTEFSIGKGEKKNIRVALEAMKLRTFGKTTENDDASIPNFALQFDGRGYVHIPSLHYDGSHPVTIEAFYRGDDRDWGDLISLSGNLTLNLDGSSRVIA